ncbi:uncharacterized protein TNCT_518811 [Trichonephila clavata]|uniref:Uncharacterized protein n=1 Tax=Trichonephila clavata TaxID=2740835 RepID=A0A8X6L807_TRICU|nr:uncharacterized protein TNCT_518811 [Trichonephila clavata]
MPSKLKAWLKAKLGFGGRVRYKTLAEEENEVEPVVTYNCDYCDYRSPTQKGLRCHRITVHRIGVGVRRTLDSHGRPLAYFDVKRRKTFPSCSEDAVWTANFYHQELLGSKLVISASMCTAYNQVSGCLDYKFSHISRCLDTIKCA